MILTAHQPNYLPYPGFFRKIAAAEEFLVVDTTQFVKRGPFGWIHRNRIRTPNGPIWLTLPVLSKGRYHQTILEVELDPTRDWAKKHWKSIEWNYRRAPFWERFAPGLCAIYERPWHRIAPFNIEIIRWFLAELALERPVHLASELAATGASTDYILAFCRELGADVFLSGKHGRDYLEVEKFATAGIELLFQEYEPPRYTPPGGTEMENLSMLDLLLWKGDEAIEWVHEGSRSLA